MKPAVKYGLLFLLLLLIEILIALYVHDAFVRPFLGDALVVILIYCFVLYCSSLLQLPVSKLWVAIGVLLFALVVELGQAMDLLDLLGLRDYTLARMILGTSYDWRDLVAYFGGFIFLRATDH